MNTLFLAGRNIHEDVTLVAYDSPDPHPVAVICFIAALLLAMFAVVWGAYAVTKLLRHARL